MVLMEGEEPGTDDVVDARHWQEVYAKLVEFTARTAAQAPGAMVDERLERYRARLSFWTDRVWNLESIVVDDIRRTVANWSGGVSLTRREFQILKLLLEYPGRAFSARRLLLDAWHDPALPEEAVRSYIGRIRRKLNGIDLAVIVTDPTRGYRLEFAAASTPVGALPPPVPVRSLQATN